MTAHVVEEKLEVEKVRRKIGGFSRNVRYYDFSIYKKKILENFFHFCFLEMFEIF
jgi:hypothetical protein